MPDDSYPTVYRSFAPKEFRPYDPMTPYVERGVDLLKSGVTNASEWASSMVDEFGERILPYVENIRGQAQAVVSAFTPGVAFNPAPFANETNPVSSRSLP